MPGLVLYSRDGCHLCEDMAQALHAMLRGTDVRFRTVDVDTDPGLRETYGLRIPVLVLDGEVLCEARLDEDAVRDALGSG